MSEPLTMRRLLIHSYSLGRGEQFHTEWGRKGMLAEFVASDALPRKASDPMHGMRGALQRALSGDEEIMDSGEGLFSIQVNVPDKKT